MPRSLLLSLITVTSFLPLQAQTTSTLCQGEEVAITSLTTDLRLVGCGDGFADNLLWHLDRADSVDGSLDAKSRRVATGRGAVVYVMDTGVMRDHDEFMRADGSNVIGGFQPAVALGVPPAKCPDGHDPALEPCYTTDGTLFIYTHGTAVASVVAGRNTGVAPDAKIVSVFMMTNAEVVRLWVEALDHIIRHAWAPTTPQFKTGIVNMSQVPGFNTSAAKFTPIEQKIREMIDGVDAEGRPDREGKRFLFVAAAGNVPLPGTPSQFSHCDDDGASRLYPSILGPSIDGLIAVGGIDDQNQAWAGACEGLAVELLAPAKNILVASITGRDHYRSGHAPPGIAVPNSGTSYATPYVAGLAACLLEKHPDLTPQQVEARLKATASRVHDADAPALGRVAIFEVGSTLPKRRVVHR